jgi:hypothetical protein
MVGMVASCSTARRIASMVACRMFRVSISWCEHSAMAQASACSRMMRRQLVAARLGQLLGVAQALDRPLRVEDDGGGVHRPGQRAAPGLVHAADDVDERERTAPGRQARIEIELLLGHFSLIVCL